MLRGIIVAALILVVGNQLSERVRLKQEELILNNLPEQQAIAYYDLLRKRVRRTRILRAIVLASFMVTAMAVKRIILMRSGTP
ncbi:MAG: hypothetical protein SGI86_19440 [Deltaproteobacteria bacterium]|nr:hypothetical protein [Deltaproteobacteria bacterium]